MVQKAVVNARLRPRPCRSGVPRRLHRVTPHVSAPFPPRPMDPRSAGDVMRPRPVSSTPDATPTLGGHHRAKGVTLDPPGGRSPFGRGPHESQGRCQKETNVLLRRPCGGVASRRSKERRSRCQPRRRAATSNAAPRRPSDIASAAAGVASRPVNAVPPCPPTAAAGRDDGHRCVIGGGDRGSAGVGSRAVAVLTPRPVSLKGCASHAASRRARAATARYRRYVRVGRRHGDVREGGIAGVRTR